MSRHPRQGATFKTPDRAWETELDERDAAAASSPPGAGRCAPAWNEVERLAALARYAILDTGREEVFDTIVEIAADLLDAPIAVVNLVADTRQWFKAEIGIGVREMPLDVSICRHAILQPGVCVVPDLTADPRFSTNPLVRADGGLRFYAGALLETADGLPLGTVCVLDTKPRPEGITPRQRRALSSLAAQAMAQLELRRSETIARQARLRAEEHGRRLAAIFGQAPAGLSEISLDGRFLQVNDALCALVGRPREELLALNVADVTAPEDLAASRALLARVTGTGEPGMVEKQYRRPDGSHVWASSSVTRIAGSGDQPPTLLAVTVDVTERRQAEARQALLAREVDHRAKNALTVVLAAVRLTRAPDLAAYIRAIEGRVAALARAQTLLAEDRWTGADLRTLLRGELAAFLADAGEGPQAALSGPDITLPPRAAQPIVMALHELATNAVKHGALSSADGRVDVGWDVLGGPEGTLRLTWRESGGPPVEGPPERRGFGSRVLQGTIGDQLGGRVATGWERSGVTCLIEVPLRRLLGGEAQRG